ncbi:MAG: hypothetical protein GX256_03345 [Fretibacterium sp.]|nr:hypothetical protein [Fretibacterium sp.]
MSLWDDDNAFPMEKFEGLLAEGAEQAKDDTPRTVAGALLQICHDLGVIPFVAEGINDLFVRYLVDGHQEINGLRSRQFRSWLAEKYFANAKVEPKGADLDGALLLLEAKAYRSMPRKLHTRIGRMDGKIYIDLCNKEHQAVEIDADGWRVVDEPPLWFLRSSMEELPVPVLGGSLMELREFVNTSDDDFALIIGWLLVSLVPDISYPILAISSEHGSGKSTLTNFLKALIDPDNTGGLAPFKDVDALYVTAASRHVVALDNLSWISARDSDHFSRLATGGGVSRRKLYTDGETYESYLRKPQILNGIDFTPDRPDLIDRCYPVNLLPLIKGGIAERELWAAFERARPRIFGALLSAASAALREKDYKPGLKMRTRMIDAAMFVMRVERGGALPWELGTFERVLLEKERSKQIDAVANNPTGRILLELVDNTGGWKGLQKDLFDLVRDKVRPEEKIVLPKADRGFGDVLSRLTPMLRGLGVVIHKTRRNSGMWITLARAEETVNTGEELSGDNEVYVVYVGNPTYTSMYTSKNLATTGFNGNSVRRVRHLPTSDVVDKKTPDTPLSEVSGLFSEEIQRNCVSTYTTYTQGKKQGLNHCPTTVYSGVCRGVDSKSDVHDIHQSLPGASPGQSPPPVDNSKRDAQFYFDFLDNPGGAANGD